MSIHQLVACLDVLANELVTTITHTRFVITVEGLFELGVPKSREIESKNLHRNVAIAISVNSVENFLNHLELDINV